MQPRKVGPGVVTLTGDQRIDEVVANTTLTVIDGQLDVGIMRDSVEMKTQQSTSTLPLNIKVKQIMGTGSIDAAGKVFVERPFKERVVIGAANDIIANAIGNTSELTARNGRISVKSVGAVCLLTATGDIQADHVGSFSRIVSSSGKVEVDYLGNNCSVDAEDNLFVKGSTGVSCALNSNLQRIYVACNVGSGTSLNAKKSVVCRGNVDANSSLTSQTDEIEIFGKVDDGVSFNAAKKISVRCGIGVQSVLVSVNDTLEVQGKIESKAVLSAFKGITIRGELEQSVQVIATNGPIVIDDGIVGSESELQAVGLIKVKGYVQDKATIICNDGKIEIFGKVSDSAVLIADEVYINGVKQNQIPAATKKEIKPNIQPSFWARDNRQPYHEVSKRCDNNL